MNKYGLTFNNGDGTILVEAEYFSIESGFICFYRQDMCATYEKFAIYSCDSVLHCVQQKEYTEAEILKDMDELQ